MQRRRAGWLALGMVLLAFAAAPAGAVLIASGNGTGNTGPPPDDPGFAHAGVLSNNSAVYLGDGWVLTANHVSVGSVTLGGVYHAAVPGTTVQLELHARRAHRPEAVPAGDRPGPSVALHRSGVPRGGRAGRDDRTRAQPRGGDLLERPRRLALGLGAHDALGHQQRGAHEPERRPRPLDDPRLQPRLRRRRRHHGRGGGRDGRLGGAGLRRERSGLRARRADLRDLLATSASRPPPRCSATAPTRRTSATTGTRSSPSPPAAPAPTAATTTATASSTSRTPAASTPPTPSRPTRSCPATTASTTTPTASSTGPTIRAAGTPLSLLENPQCDDNLDNDGDGGIDWDGGPAAGPTDPECAGMPWRNMEMPVQGCGLGFELVLLVPLLRRLRRLRRVG